MLRSSLKFCVFGLATLVCSPLVLADTAIVPWSGNGHYYQRVDKSLSWFSAKDECAAKKGHLATVTSAPEFAFLQDNILSYYYAFALGGTKENTGVWRWITGETFSYTPGNNFSNEAGEDYLYATGSQFRDVTGTPTLYGYICEWDYENHIATATIPNVNAGGIEEIASLYTDKLNTKFYVRLKDSSTGTLINNGILFGETATAKPIAVAGIKDTNSNLKPEIAVLASSYGTQSPSVIIKDSSTKELLKTLPFFTSGYDAKGISVVKDINANGYDEISVMATKAGVTTVQIKDSKSGSLLKQFTM